MIKKLAVFCGAYTGKDAQFSDSCQVLARVLVKNQIELIYGGANIGLMGVLADEMLSLNGQVIGVMPKSLSAHEIMHENATKMHIVNSMDERKRLIIAMADAFVLLPGGIGSMDEFFEVFTLGKLDLHQKPFGILNINGYYDLLLQFLNHMVDHGFLHEQHREMIVVENDPTRLIARLAEPPKLSTSPLAVHLEHCHAESK